MNFNLTALSNLSKFNTLFPTPQKSDDVKPVLNNVELGASMTLSSQFEVLDKNKDGFLNNTEIKLSNLDEQTKKVFLDHNHELMFASIQSDPAAWRGVGKVDLEKIQARLQAGETLKGISSKLREEYARSRGVIGANEQVDEQTLIQKFKDYAVRNGFDPNIADPKGVLADTATLQEVLRKADNLDKDKLGGQRPGQGDGEVTLQEIKDFIAYQQSLGGYEIDAKLLHGAMHLEDHYDTLNQGGKGITSPDLTVLANADGNAATLSMDDLEKAPAPYASLGIMKDYQIAANDADMSGVVYKMDERTGEYLIDPKTGDRIIDTEKSRAGAGDGIATKEELQAYIDRYKGKESDPNFSLWQGLIRGAEHMLNSYDKFDTNGDGITYNKNFNREHSKYAGDEITALARQDGDIDNITASDINSTRNTGVLASTVSMQDVIFGADHFNADAKSGTPRAGQGDGETTLEEITSYISYLQSQKPDDRNIRDLHTAFQIQKFFEEMNLGGAGITKDDVAQLAQADGDAYTVSMDDLEKAPAPHATLGIANDYQSFAYSADYFGAVMKYDRETGRTIIDPDKSRPGAGDGIVTKEEIISYLEYKKKHESDPNHRLGEGTERAGETMLKFFAQFSGDDGYLSYNKNYGNPKLPDPGDDISRIARKDGNTRNITAADLQG